MRALIMALCLWAGINLLQASVAEPQRLVEQPPRPIAGIPFDEALKIYKRHAEELRQLPGAGGVSITAEGSVVETVHSAALPAAVEGLPVIPVPPVDPREAATWNEELATTPLPSQEPALDTTPRLA